MGPSLAKRLYASTVLDFYYTFFRFFKMYIFIGWSRPSVNWVENDTDYW